MDKLRGAVAHDVTKNDRTADVILQEGMEFAHMLLNERTLAGLHKAGYRRPSPIQLSAIPVGRIGTDLIVEAKSGTGKTLVFTIIALEMIDLTIPQLQVLIVAPTREIAMQIKEVLSSVGCEHVGLKISAFIGGTSMKSDVSAAAACHIAVGTPGRLKRLVMNGNLLLRSTRLFVLDEADCLVTESFKNDINYIFCQLPERKQTIVSSATFPLPLEQLLCLYLVHPHRISTTPSATPLLLGLHQYVAITRAHTSPLVRVQNKTAKLIAILSSLPFRQCLIFCNLQSRMEGICRELASKGWPALHLAGSMQQTQRLTTVAALQSQRCRVLLTTDLAARGIDAEQVDLVVNMDLPYDTETYLHRIGRAGRFGGVGIAVSIVEDGLELTKLKHVFHDVGGSDFKVPLLPDDMSTPGAWTENATLNFVKSLSRDDDKKQDLPLETRTELKEQNINGQKNGFERLESVEKYAKRNDILDDENISRDDAIEIMRSQMTKLSEGSFISFGTFKEKCDKNDTNFGNIIEQGTNADQSQLLKAFDVLMTKKGSEEVNDHLVEGFKEMCIDDESHDESNGDSEYLEESDYSDISGSSDISSSLTDDNSSSFDEEEDIPTHLHKKQAGCKISSDKSRISPNSVPTNTSHHNYWGLVAHSNGPPTYGPNACECHVCYSWFREWRRQLSYHRQYMQRQFYIKAMLEN